MSIRSIVVQYAPKPIRRILKPVARFIMRNKYASEMSFWISRLEMDRGKFVNSHYERLMLGMAGENNDSFLKGKVVADFGCGPRGSLVWAKSAFLRIGIDVLADSYADRFKENIISHNMVYLKCTEHVIPLPSEFVDVMFTLNALDHVTHFETMCSEIIRVLKPGGLFVGSINLEGRPTPQEPQRLTEQIIQDHLLSKMVVESYRLSRKGSEPNLYEPFFSGNLSYEPGEEGILWVRATKATKNA